jgi:hypothetical protein
MGVRCSLSEASVWSFFWEDVFCYDLYSYFSPMY